MSSSIKITGLLALAGSVAAVPHYQHEKFHNHAAYPAGGWGASNSTAPAGTDSAVYGEPTTTLDTTSTAINTSYTTVYVKPSPYPGLPQANAVDAYAPGCSATVTVTAKERVTVTVTPGGGAAAYPAPSEPAEYPAPPEPAEYPAPSMPAEYPAPSKPAEMPAPSKPAEMPAPSEPAEYPAPSMPAEMPAPSKPAEMPAPSKPAKMPAPSKPAEMPAPSEPAEYPAPSMPAEYPTPSMPAEMPAPSKPAEMPAPSEPAEYPAPSMPAEYPAPSKPAEMPAPSKPAEMPAPSKPAPSKPAPSKPAETPVYSAPATPSASKPVGGAFPTGTPGLGNMYSGAKRGLAYNNAELCSTLGSSYGFGYNWAQAESNDIGTMFIPMMHKPSDSTAEAWLANVDKAVKKGSKAVMGFNECDIASQCNLSPEAACSSWKEYMNPVKEAHPDVTIIGPSVSNGQAPLGLDWLSRFHTACPDAKVDATNIHFYDVYDDKTIDRFTAHVKQAASTYGQKVWVTEFGLNPGSATQEQAASFLKDCMAYLDSSDDVQGYSWFMVGTGENQLNFADGLSPIGKVYAGSY